MEGDIVVGGSYDDERRFIAPALIDIDAIGPDAAIMQQEVFAPILPMMSFEAIDQVIAFITSRPKPLAFYLFTSSRATEKRFLSSCSLRRRLHKRYHNSSCFLRAAVWRGRRKRHGQLSRQKEL